MNISRIIPEILVKDQEVNIPDLGKFTYEYVSAEMYKFTNRVAPPAHKLDFSVNYDPQDQTLVDYCMLDYDCTREEASAAIQNWVEEIKSVLQYGGQYTIEEVGFLKNDAGKLHFTTDKNSMLFADSFGLETAKIPLIEIEEPKINKPIVPPVTPTPIAVKQKKKLVIMPALKKIAIVTGIILVTAFLVYVVIESGIYKTAYTSVAGLFKHKHEEKNIVLNDSTEAMKREALRYSEQDTTATVSAAHKAIVYYIIAGSFKSAANAEKAELKFKNKGFSTQVLNVNDTLYRLSIGSYADRKKAVEEYIALSNQDSDLKIWLYSQLEKVQN